MIDTRIETFLTLCAEMNYRRTAERLNMTQPAVTQHIHALEAQYGCKLFCYDRRTLSMTREAEILRKYAENIVYQEKKLRYALSGDAGIHLSIGATKTIGEYVISGHISDFLSAPENTISVDVDNTETLLSKVSSGEIDFALIEGYFDKSRYASSLYKTEQFVGLCSNNHPFANRRISVDEIWDETLILREAGSGTRDILEQLLTEGNHALSEFKRIITVSNFGLITKLLQDSLFITFAYRAVAAEQTALAEFQVIGWETAREFNYVYLDTPFSEYAVQHFRNAAVRLHPQ